MKSSKLYGRFEPEILISLQGFDEITQIISDLRKLYPPTHKLLYEALADYESITMELGARIREQTQELNAEPKMRVE